VGGLKKAKKGTGRSRQKSKEKGWATHPSERINGCHGSDSKEVGAMDFLVKSSPREKTRKGFGLHNETHGDLERKLTRGWGDRFRKNRVRLRKKAVMFSPKPRGPGIRQKEENGGGCSTRGRGMVKMKNRGCTKKRKSPKKR